MHHLYHADALLIEKKENFQKQTYRNRCEIMGANGKLALSVPVIKVRGNHTPIDQVMVSRAEPWVKKYCRAIESAYNASPFFIYYKDEIFNVLASEGSNLFELNFRLLKTLIGLIGFDKKLVFTRNYQDDMQGITDLRYSISPKARRPEYIFDPYPQVFTEKHGFEEDLSIIDLLFNEGPACIDYLKNGIRKK